MPLTQLLSRPADWRNSVLGYACFTASHHAIVEPTADIPSISVFAPPLLGTPDGFCEIWRTDAPLASGRRGALRYRYSDHLLFGCIDQAESLFASDADNPLGLTPLRQAVEFAYREIFALLDGLGYPHLYRVWNYFPHINRESHGIERYRQFNLGRQDGFLAAGRTPIGNVPAACALGTTDGPLSLCFLAGCHKPLFIENPRQLSAYHYPPQYGPRSPTFARATLARIGAQEILFVSGTASIVGHQSLHADDVTAQTRETMSNIQIILREANRRAFRPAFELGKCRFNVYVRRASDASAIRKELIKIIGPQADMVFLRADICRQELSVEIEATAGHFIGYPNGTRPGSDGQPS